MRIESVAVEHFRSLREASIEFNDLTALIGPNGAGKSSFLRAVDLFYTPTASYSEEDFYNRDTSRPMSVRVKFVELGKHAREKFDSYVDGDTLTVEKVMDYPDNKSNQRYYGNRLANPDFDDFRTASGQGLRAEYNALREGEYSELPSYQNQTEAEEALQAWELDHPDRCERQRDDGQFFGFNPVGQAALEEFTQYILIPAVRDASEDAADRSGSPLEDLMDVVVRATLAEREELESFREETQQRYDALVEEAAEAELDELEGDLSTTLDTFAPGVGVDLTWNTEGGIDLAMPKAEIRLEEDDFSSAVEHAGHGSQRAFIISLLQTLAVRGERAERDDEEEPSLILGIEEPELYQHPNRQRHLMSILSSFEEQEVAGAASSVQVVYCTHSPLLVNMRRFDDVRSLFKVSGADGPPKETAVYLSSLEAVARRLEEVADVAAGTFTAESTRARLETVMTPWMNEGFFADGVILVEGPEDRAALLGRARAMDVDLSAAGIAVLPCNGKTKIDRPAVIFEHLGKAVYVMFDADHDDEDEVRMNRLLQRLVGAETDERWPSGVHENYACFRTTLTNAVEDALGADFYEETLRTVCDEYGYTDLSRGRKNPTVMGEVFFRADDEGKEVPELDGVIERAVSLVQSYHEARADDR